MSTPTTSVTVQAINSGALVSKSAVTLPVGGSVQISSTSLDANGLNSGHHVKYSSSDNNIAIPMTANVLGAAPASIRAISPGTATITATSADNALATATIVITVTP